MPSTIRIYRSGELVAVTYGSHGESLYACIAAAGICIDSPCGGKGKCRKCLIRLGYGDEQALACQTYVDGEMDVHLPEELAMDIAGSQIEYETPDSGFRVPNPDAKRLCGIAVDIGTTTVVVHLTDIKTGLRLATASGVNAQRTYGADVISRIQYCADNGHEMLVRAIRKQLASLIRETCIACAEKAEDIVYISIAANTIMEHLAAGYSPVGMGAVPFTPISLFGEELAAGDDLPVSDSAMIYFAPAISAYVGGDITAGMLAAGLEETAAVVLYLDIGTNGEVVLKSGGDADSCTLSKYYCCATAAGPAFEGAEITMGMAAVSGAIDHVKWDDGLKLSVIGGGPPIGLCGSGLLDALAVLLEKGAVEETGRMLDPDEIDHVIRKHIAKKDGKTVFCLTGESSQARGISAQAPGENCGVYITASDIRKLQLAKSAIAAGIQTLLSHAKVEVEQVESFILAGGFGSFMDLGSAARVGLFPKEFLPVAKTLGNTAGEGAALALCSQDARVALRDLSTRCEYVELSTSAVFNEQFVEQMMFS